LNATVFYILAAATVLSTLMAITRREMVHAVVYLVLSFFCLALIFFMMGAPLVAALEVLVYAGAIMVLFLFIVMMLEMGTPKRRLTPYWKVWGPAAALGAIILACTVLLLSSGPLAGLAAGVAYISPRAFGQALFTGHALAVEVVSMLLLFALVGALYLGRHD
jgi:NADH-quinone oxidoreductase subunit J